jgi:hypothetical protein
MSLKVFWHDGNVNVVPSSFHLLIHLLLLFLYFKESMFAWLMQNNTIQLYSTLSSTIDCFQFIWIYSLFFFVLCLIILFDFFFIFIFAFISYGYLINIAISNNNNNNNVNQNYYFFLFFLFFISVINDIIYSIIIKV